MGCEFIQLPGGGSAVICGQRPAKPKPCWECTRPHQFLCDGPSLAGKKGDCNRPLCADHRTPAGAGVDYCSEHAAVLRLL